MVPETEGDTEADPVTSEFAWLALGCNVGHRTRALACLRDALRGSGLTLLATSSELLTRPVGVTGQGDFHNQVLLVRAAAPLDARAWLRLCQAAERACGRRPTYHWGPRRADCDILLLGEGGELRHDGDPQVPHPEIGNRPFISRLLAEIDQNVAAAANRGPSG